MLRYTQRKFHDAPVPNADVDSAYLLLPPPFTLFRHGYNRHRGRCAYLLNRLDKNAFDANTNLSHYFTPLSEDDLPIIRLLDGTRTAGDIDALLHTSGHSIPSERLRNVIQRLITADSLVALDCALTLRDRLALLRDLRASSRLSSTSRNFFAIYQRNFCRVDYPTAPYALTIIPTANCNANCRFCFAGSNRKTDSSSRPIWYWERWIKDAGRSGVDMISLLGGEPLLYPDIDNMLACVLSHNMGVCLFTNALLLHDNGRVGAIASILRHQYHTVQTSIDGSADSHDRYRKGLPFRRIVRVVENMIARHINVSVSMVVDRSNQQDVPDHYRLMESLGVQTVIYSPLKVCGSANDMAGMVLTPADIEALRKTIIECGQKHSTVKAFLNIHMPIYRDPKTNRLDLFETREIFSCRCFTEDFAFAPDGSILPCTYFLPIRDYWESNTFDSIHDIWTTSRLARRFRGIRHRGKCANCVYRGACNVKCPAESYTALRDIEAPSPLCEYELSQETSEWSHETVDEAAHCLF